MRLLRQRAAELSSPPPPARSNRGRSFAQGLDARNLLLLLECTGAIMSSQCTTHNPPSCACMCPSARNAVRSAVSALAVRVCCRCLCFPISSHLLCPLRGGGATTKPGRTSQVADHHHSKITCTPRPTSSLYTLIITTLSVPPLSSPLASLSFPARHAGHVCVANHSKSTSSLQVICQAWRSKRGGIQVTHRYRVKLTRSFLV